MLCVVKASSKLSLRDRSMGLELFIDSKLYIIYPSHGRLPSACQLSLSHHGSASAYQVIA